MESKFPKQYAHRKGILFFYFHSLYAGKGSLAIAFANRFTKYTGLLKICKLFISLPPYHPPPRPRGRGGGGFI
nr:MAG TPA: hypothetical protein [Caudoviricetes sp.]